VGHVIVGQFRERLEGGPTHATSDGVLPSSDTPATDTQLAERHRASESTEHPFGIADVVVGKGRRPRQIERLDSMV
jgi:hypothetical protein